MALAKSIHLSQALDLVANDYGFTHWAFLMNHFNSIQLNDVASVWNTFLPGEMVLLSAAIVQQHASRMLILSQDHIDNERSHGRYFSHAIHLEQQKVANQEQRHISLLKSIHYRKQKSLLQFNKENYRFV